MRYRGKVIGFLLGLFSGVGFWGIVGGVLLGHLVDTVMSNFAGNFKGTAHS